MVVWFYTSRSAPIESRAPASVAAPIPPPPAPASESARSEEPFEKRFARDMKQKFLTQAAGDDTTEAARAWVLMMEADPKALDDSEVRKKTVSVVTRAEPEEESMRKMFYQLAYRTGSIGLDLLYQVVEDAPGSGAALRSEPILYRVINSDRVSTELRITLEIRRLNCSRKVLLFDRAGKEGDERTARQLEKLKPPSCDVGKGVCCLNDDSKLEKALADIRERAKTQ
jgi:hypothetical protein